jgi:hypothetical protein
MGEGMRTRKVGEGKVVLLALGLALVAVPRFAAAAVVVDDPTGDADPAFLASSAPKPDVENAPAVAVAKEKSTTEERAPLPVKYDRHKALAMSMLLTASPHLVGGVIATLGSLAPDDGHDMIIGCLAAGSSLMGVGLILGPSSGYFWIGRTRHALKMAGVRLLTMTTTVVTMFLIIESIGYGEIDNEGRCKGETVWGMDACSVGAASPWLLGISIASYIGTMVLAYVDAAFVGRVADRANAEWRDQNEPTVTVAPVAWTNGSGSATFGLAVSGSF